MLSHIQTPYTLFFSVDSSKRAVIDSSIQNKKETVSNN